MIHIFASDGSKHIPGFKEQTEKSDIVLYQPKKVYIPATDNKGVSLVNPITVGAKVKIGTLIGQRGDFGINVYSPVSGTVLGIVKKRNTILNRPADFFEIENDAKDERVYLEPIGSNPSKQQVVDKIKEGGIVGLGGAGFPTYIKFGTKDHIDTLLINAAECEPYITTDFVRGTRENLDCFFKTIAILLDALEIGSCVIATKTEKVELVNTLKTACANFNDKRIVVSTCKSVYPAGYERTLISLCLKRSYKKLPSECGVIVDNFQTIFAIGQLFTKGETIAKKLITVAGEVAKPANVLTPYGLLVEDLLSSVGGPTIEEGSVINGGPMCGENFPSGDIPIGIASNAVTVLPVKKIKEQPCWRCGECTAHCPCNLQPCEINYAAKRNDYERVFDLNVSECVSCGLCSYVCPSHIDVSAGVKQAKTMVVFKCPRAQQKK